MKNMILNTIISTMKPIWGDQWGVLRICAESGWSFRNRGVSVIMLDTGADIGHPDLNITGEGSGLLSMEKKDKTHGTEVAGIIGARTNNSMGVAGTGWDTVAPFVKTVFSRI